MKRIAAIAAQDLKDQGADLPAQYVRKNGTTYVPSEARKATVENSQKLPRPEGSLRRYGRRAASGRPESPAWDRKGMSWQQQQYGAGGGPPKKRFANLATGGHPQAQAQAAHSTNFQAPNQYQSNGTASSSVANPYSVSLPMGTSNSHIVGSSAAGSAAPALAFPGTQVYPPPQHMHAHMHQVNTTSNQRQHQAYLNNLLLQQQQQQAQAQAQQQQAQMQQIQQHHQQQLGLQLQLQIQQQEQQRRQEQIQLAALAHQAHQQQVHATGSIQAHNNLQGVVAPAAVAATDNVPSPSKKRPLPTPVGEYGRSQSMPPDIGRERGAETNDDHDTSEDDEKLAAAEEEERKPAAPTATKPRKPPKPMPETTYKGIVKGGLTKDDIKDHKIDVAASKMKKSKGKVKKLDGRPPRAASSSSLRRTSSLPVSKVDKRCRRRRIQTRRGEGEGKEKEKEKEQNEDKEKKNQKKQKKRKDKGREQKQKQKEKKKQEEIQLGMGRRRSRTTKKEKGKGKAGEKEQKKGRRMIRRKTTRRGRRREGKGEGEGAE